MKLFQLAWDDLIKGIVVAAITAFLTALLPTIQAGRLPKLSELGVCGIAGITAGIAYLIKNFLTNSKDQMFKAEPNETEVKTPTA